MLLDMKSRGLNSPKLTIGDGGAMTFWPAFDEVYPDTDLQRFRVHKTANILNQLPRSLQTKVKQSLHNFWQAETK